MYSHEHFGQGGRFSIIPSEYPAWDSAPHGRDAAKLEDAWSVALHTVDLEDVERLGRVNGVDLSGGADEAGVV
ncbi:hypothetical protein [Streptomyces sp. NBC_01615]|uniref:hypothetical protein n=1 Tax=Streptomyces sp. NBC_01615 TaxID=2975898 RepID=UPI003867E568